jgi:hypothetical protein
LVWHPVRDEYSNLLFVAAVWPRVFLSEIHAPKEIELQDIFVAVLPFIAL